MDVPRLRGGDFHARHDHGLHARRRPCTGVAARIPKASSGECVIKPEKDTGVM